MKQMCSGYKLSIISNIGRNSSVSRHRYNADPFHCTTCALDMGAPDALRKTETQGAPIKAMMLSLPIALPVLWTGKPQLLWLRAGAVWATNTSMVPGPWIIADAWWPESLQVFWQKAWSKVSPITNMVLTSLTTDVFWREGPKWSDHKVEQNYLLVHVSSQ